MSETKQEAIMKLHLPNGTFEESVLLPLSKHIKEDPQYTKQLVYAYLSAYADPYNLGSLAPSSEGKTYPAVTVADLFPTKDVLILGGLSPTALIHDHGILVGPNNEPLEDTVKELDERITENESRLAEASNKGEIKQHISMDKDVRRTLLKESRYLIDLTDKILLFLEPPHYDTWNRLKPILSHDKYEIEFRITEKSSRGQLKTNHIVIRGWPVSIFCSAKNEQSKWSIWPEIESRHEITSPTMSSAKYKAANKLSGIKKGLPQIVVDQVLNKAGIEEAKEYIQLLINRIKDFRCAVSAHTKTPYPSLVWIPFEELLVENYPSDNGPRMREYARLLSKISIIALAHMNARPFIMIDGIPAIIPTFDDLAETMEITSSVMEIAPFKPRWFNEVFKEAIKQSGKENINTKMLQEFMAKQGCSLSTKKIRDMYLRDLEEHGYIKSEADDKDARANLYSVDNDTDSNSVRGCIGGLNAFSPEWLKHAWNSLLNRTRESGVKLQYEEKIITIDELFLICTQSTRLIFTENQVQNQIDPYTPSRHPNFNPNPSPIWHPWTWQNKELDPLYIYSAVSTSISSHSSSSTDLEGGESK